MSKTPKPTRRRRRAAVRQPTPRFPEGEVLGHAAFLGGGVIVAADQHGRAWRIDAQEGTMSPLKVVRS